MEVKMLANVLVRRYTFEKSKLHSVDNRGQFASPMLFYLLFETPTFVRISRRHDKKDKEADCIAMQVSARMNEELKHQEKTVL